MDYFKLLNRTALILFIIFLIWYYLPDNREIRGIDPCTYYAIKQNLTCECHSYKPGEIGTTKYFFPNGSVSKKEEGRIYNPTRFREKGVLFNVTA